MSDYNAMNAPLADVIDIESSLESIVDGIHEGSRIVFDLLKNEAVTVDEALLAVETAQLMSVGWNAVGDTVILLARARLRETQLKEDH